MAVDSVESTDIRELIKCWVEWMRTNSGSAFTTGLVSKYAPRGGHGQGYILVRNPRAEALDVLIAKLCLHRGEQSQQLFFMHHLEGYSVRQLAVKLRLDRDRVGKELEAAEAWLDGMARGTGLIG